MEELFYTRSTGSGLASHRDTQPRPLVFAVYGRVLAPTLSGGRAQASMGAWSSCKYRGSHTLGHCSLLLCCPDPNWPWTVIRTLECFPQFNPLATDFCCLFVAAFVFFGRAGPEASLLQGFLRCPSGMTGDSALRGCGQHHSVVKTGQSLLRKFPF